MQVDATRHLLPLGFARHLYRGCERTTGWWSIALRDSHSDGTQTDTSLAIFKRTRYSYTHSRAVDTTALFAGCFAEAECCQLFGYINWIDKKKDLVCIREKLNKKKEKKLGNHFTRLFENSNVFWKLRRVSNLWKIRKTQDWNYWTYKWNISMERSLSLSLLFFCASDALPKKYRALLLVYCFEYFDRQRERSDKASHPASRALWWNQSCVSASHK